MAASIQADLLSDCFEYKDLTSARRQNVQVFFVLQMQILLSEQRPEQPQHEQYAYGRNGDSHKTPGSHAATSHGTAHGIFTFPILGIPKECPDSNGYHNNPNPHTHLTFLQVKHLFHAAKIRQTSPPCTTKRPLLYEMGVSLYEIYFCPNIVLIILRPIFRSMPALDIGKPVTRASLCFACVIPSARFHEKERPGMRVDDLLIPCY